MDGQPLTVKFRAGGAGGRHCSLTTYNTDNLKTFNAPTKDYFYEDKKRERRYEMDTSLKSSLDSFVLNTNYFSQQFGSNGGIGYGDMKVIGSSGTLRTRDGSPSYHYVCGAIDIVWIGWAKSKTSASTGTGTSNDDAYDYVASRPCHGKHEAVLSPSQNGSDAAPSLTTYRRLVAVEAGLRKWFGYVLNRNISGHDNHFHVDNGCPVGLRIKEAVTKDNKDDSKNRPYTSCHFFLQDCVRAFTDEKPAYDGVWGPSPEHGYRTLLSDLGMECLDPVKYVNHYMLLLDYIMMHGFADKSAGAFRWGDHVLV